MNINFDSLAITSSNLASRSLWITKPNWEGKANKSVYI